MRNALLCILALVLVACGRGEEATPTPTATEVPTLLPSLTPTPFQTPTLIATFVLDGSYFDNFPESTAEATPDLVFEPVEDEVIPAPITVDLPEGWTTQVGTSGFEDVVGLRLVPFTAYYGPVTGGTGYIIVVWGFGSVYFENPFEITGEGINLGADGMRMLRLAVMYGCNIGHNLEFETEFEVGGQIGLGSYFSAVDCPDRPDTRGWYAALYQEGLNYAFYAYAEPIEAMDNAGGSELQAILDTVEFFPLQIPAEATAEVTAEASTSDQP